MGQWLELLAHSSQSPDLVHATPADTAPVLRVSGWDPVGGLVGVRCCTELGTSATDSEQQNKLRRWKLQLVTYE